MAVGAYKVPVGDMGTNKLGVGRPKDVEGADMVGTKSASLEGAPKD